MPDTITRTYDTDRAGNRLAPRDMYPARPDGWEDNRIREDAGWFYHHTGRGRLIQKDERAIRDGGNHCHFCDYDSRHQLKQHTVRQMAHITEKRLSVRSAGATHEETGAADSATGSARVTISGTKSVQFFLLAFAARSIRSRSADLIRRFSVS